MCSTGVNSPSGHVITLDDPLEVLTRRALPFRLVAVFNASTSTRTRTPSVSQERNVSVSVGCVGTSNPPVSLRAGAPRPPLPAACPTPWHTLVPTLPANELTRRRMQKQAASGWGLWHQMDFLKQVQKEPKFGI